MKAADPQQRAGRLETVGAWLHVWTPPRDVHVPPPPSPRQLALGALAVGIPLAIVLVIVIGAIDTGKQHGATERARAQAALLARQRAFLRVDQAPHRGRGRPLPHGAPPARLLAARAGLIDDLRRAITADARARYRRHALSRPVIGTACQPYVRPEVPNPPQPPPNAREGRYECVAATGELNAGTPRASATTGFPFWARVDFRNSTFVWCKTNERPGEGVVNHELAFVPLPAACDLTR